MGYIISRLREPSTWASIASLSALVAQFYPPAIPIAGAIGVAAAAIGMHLKERGAPS
jgi:hypothetical protein